MNQWQIGDVKITRVIEMEIAGGSRFILPDATREACLPIDWLAPHFMDEAGNLIMSIHALIVDTGERRIVVDTCIGNDKERSIPNWSHLQTTFLEDIAAAGYPRESIDTVLCTHLHVDHVGWNTMLVDGEWRPTFPNARYLVAEREWAYWDAHEDEATYGPVLADSVRPIVGRWPDGLCGLRSRALRRSSAAADPRPHTGSRQRRGRIRRPAGADHRRLHSPPLPNDPHRLVQQRRHRPSPRPGDSGNVARTLRRRRYPHHRHPLRHPDGWPCEAPRRRRLLAGRGHLTQPPAATRCSQTIRASSQRRAGGKSRGRKRPGRAETSKSRGSAESPRRLPPSAARRSACAPPAAHGPAPISAC